MKAIAFHLPQFHRTNENDGWWGEGFTDWDNVRAAEPVAPGHVIRKPHADVGYYNLLDPAVRKKQAEMAKAFNLHGFCYYHYWFGGGRRVLDKPLELLLADGEPNLPFCFCWANEQWTRRWKGSADEILMAQTYGGPDEWKAHFDYLLPFFKHPNYIRVDDEPVFYVYRPHEMEGAAERFSLWRDEARKHGLAGLHLIGKTEDWMPYGFLHLFDAAGEFAPHPPTPHQVHATQYPGALSGWDNTPRYGHRGGRRDVTPDSFERDLRAAASRAPSKMVFVFAWNEWGEGASLEPDVQYGYEFLKRLQAVATESKDRQKYAVQIVPCEGFEHRCFDDNARALAAAIAATGRDVILSEGATLTPDRTTILFGANLYRHLPRFYREALTPDAIVYNMEQAFPGSLWFDHADDIDYRLFDVWDYSTLNMEHLGCRGIETSHVPMSVVPDEPSAAAKEYDVAFLAHYAGRRGDLVGFLQQRGLSVLWQRSGLWGSDREAFYRKARVTLNASFNGPHGIFEEARVSYLVANGHFVVSERSSDSRLEAAYEGVVAFGRYDELPDLVVDWLRPERAAEREARIELGKKRMRDRFLDVVGIVGRLLSEKESRPMKTRVRWAPPPPPAYVPPPPAPPPPALHEDRPKPAPLLPDLPRDEYAPFLEAAFRLSLGQRRVVELGTGYGRVTKLLLAGAPESLVTIDRQSFAELASTHETRVTVITREAALCEPEPCDLLVADIFDFSDLKRALDRHAPLAKRLLIHGTTKHYAIGEDQRDTGVWPAVIDLLNLNEGRVTLEEHCQEGAGFVVLLRQ